MIKSNLWVKEIPQGHLRKTLFTYSPLFLAAALVALLVGSVIGIVGPYASAVLIGTIVMAFILVLRQDQLAATLVIAVHLYVDWYLGLHFVAPMMTVVLLVFFYLARSPHHRWAEPPTIGLWFLFLVFAIFPAMRNISLLDSVRYYFDIIFSAFIIFWLGLSVARDITSVRRLFKILSIFAMLIALHAIIQTITGTFLFQSTRYDAALLEASNFELSSSGVYRAGSFFINPDTSGAFFAIISLIPLGLFMESSSFLEKALYLAEILLILLALLFTYSTGAFVALFVGMIVFIIFIGRPDRRIQIPFLVAITAIVIVVALPAQVNLLLQHSVTPNELVLRNGAWQTGIKVIQAFPLTGIGLGSFNYRDLADPFRVPSQYKVLFHPHNSYLELAALGGIPLLVLFLALLFIAFYLALRNWKQADTHTRPLLAGGLAAIAVLSSNALVNPTWTHPALAVFGWLILGVISSPLLKRDTQEAQPPVPELGDISPDSLSSESKLSSKITIS